MEIKGAAIATVLGNVIGCAVFLWFYIRKKTILVPSVKLLKLDKTIIREMLWVGIPHTLEQFFSTAAIVRNTFNAIGKPLFAFGITIVRLLVLYIPFLLLFNQIWGYNGLIHAQPAEECVCMVFSLWLVLRQLKKYESCKE